MDPANESRDDPPRLLKAFPSLKFFTVTSLFAALTLTALPASAATLKIFAAASLTDGLDDALSVCNDVPAIGIYAGSGTLARQIEQGAPADIYISANPQWMDWLEKRERIAGDTRVDLLGNRLVIISWIRSDFEFDADDPWNTKLPVGPGKVAVADTETVPAGIYALQALRSDPAFRGLEDFLLPTASVREALAWVARGEIEFGIVYETDALTEPRVRAFFTFDEGAHDPIRYPAAVIADNDSPNARRLLTCLQGEEASEVFQRFGFAILGR